MKHYIFLFFLTIGFLCACSTSEVDKKHAIDQKFEKDFEAASKICVGRALKPDRKIYIGCIAQQLSKTNQTQNMIALQKIAAKNKQK